MAMIVRPERGARRARHQPRRDHQRPDRAEPEHHERVAEQPVRRAASRATARPGTPRPSACRRPRRRAGRDHRPSRGARHARDARCETANRPAARRRCPASGCTPGRQERAVRAVVEDDERPHQNPAAGPRATSTSEYETSNAAYITAVSAEVRHDRRGDVQHAAAEVRPRVRCHLRSPERTARIVAGRSRTRVDVAGSLMCLLPFGPTPRKAVDQAEAKQTGEAVLAV